MPAPRNPYLKAHQLETAREAIFRFEVEARVLTHTHSDWESYGVRQYDERWPSLAGRAITDIDGNKGRFRKVTPDSGPWVQYSIAAHDKTAMLAKLEAAIGHTDVDATETHRGQPVKRVVRVLQYNILSVTEL